MESEAVAGFDRLDDWTADLGSESHFEHQAIFPTALIIDH
jgi:hypothetical protein